VQNAKDSYTAARASPLDPFRHLPRPAPPGPQSSSKRYCLIAHVHHQVPDEFISGDGLKPYFSAGMASAAPTHVLLIPAPLPPFTTRSLDSQPARGPAGRLPPAPPAAPTRSARHKHGHPRNQQLTRSSSSLPGKSVRKHTLPTSPTSLARFHPALHRPRFIPVILENVPPFVAVSTHSYL